ncbi:MAG: cob(I)yrinic acid a,c-diamide adenosyltransferase [Verrucomicrobiota bacterium]
MTIATKTGDSGSTSLLFGRRVSKTDLRIECNGAIDELNSALGMARASLKGTSGEPFITEPIYGIQKQLITLMGEVAVAASDRDRHAHSSFGAVTPEMVEALTARVTDLEQNHKISFHGWATPGETIGSAALDFARSVCRRAERIAVAVHESDATLSPEILRYLNRLSDLCWLWARWVETDAGIAP